MESQLITFCVQTYKHTFAYFGCMLCSGSAKGVLGNRVCREGVCNCMWGTARGRGVQIGQVGVTPWHVPDMRQGTCSCRTGPFRLQNPGFMLFAHNHLRQRSRHCQGNKQDHPPLKDMAKLRSPTVPSCMRMMNLMVCVSDVQVICTKVRDGDKRIVRLKEGEPRGRHVVIVDDLVQSGGTLRECQKLLSSQVGAVKMKLPLLTPPNFLHCSATDRTPLLCNKQNTTLPLLVQTELRLEGLPLPNLYWSLDIKHAWTV